MAPIRLVRALAVVALLLPSSCLSTALLRRWLDGDEVRAVPVAYATRDGGLLILCTARYGGDFGTTRRTLVVPPGWRESAGVRSVEIPRSAVREGWPDPASAELAGALPIAVDCSGRAAPRGSRWDPDVPNVPFRPDALAALRPPSGEPTALLAFPRPPFRMYMKPMQFFLVADAPIKDDKHFTALRVVPESASPWRLLAIPIVVPVLFVAACADVVLCPIEYAVERDPAP